MSEWVSNTLGELVTFQKGRKVKTSPFPLPSYEKYLGAGALSGRHDGYGSAFLSVQANENDVLMLWDGERSGLSRSGLSGVVSSTVCKLSTTGLISSELLYYFLTHNFEWIQNRRTGTGVPHVPKDIGRILKLSYPSDKATQQKIVHILQTSDRAIEHTEALIDKYQQIKAGLMHDLFTRGIGPNGQLRPPRDHAPELYQQTPIGWIPREWSVVSLKDETMISHGFAFSGNGFFDEPPGGVLLTPGNFHRDGGLYFTSGNTKYFRGDIPPETILSSGALVTVMTDLSPQTLILGRFATVNTDFPVLHNQRIGLVKCQKPELWDRLYLVAALNNERIRKEIILGATGTTVRHTSPGRILNILIACPSMEEQKNCADMLSRIQDKLGQETSFLGKLQKQKSGLMHDLLTGKVPVTVDAATPEVAHD